MSSIVIVDDFLAMRVMLSRLLKDTGFKHIVEATNAKHALPLLKELSKKSRIQAIICDLHMPDINGLDLLKILKLDSELKRLPFLLLAEAEDLRSLSTHRHVGVFDVLVKPFNLGLTRQKLHLLKTHTEHNHSVAA